VRHEALCLSVRRVRDRRRFAVVLGVVVVEVIVVEAGHSARVGAFFPLIAVFGKTTTLAARPLP